MASLLLRQLSKRFGTIDSKIALQIRQMKVSELEALEEILFDLQYIKIISNLKIMSHFIPSSPVELYEQYLNQICPGLDFKSLSPLAADVEQTNWDEPSSALDLNNFAVMRLIEAEQSPDTSLRSMNLEIALEALEEGVKLQNHPLCLAHLSLVRQMIVERQGATQMAFSALLQIFQPTYNSLKKLSLGLVYLPSGSGNQAIERQEQLHQVLQVEDGYAQALLLLTEVLCQSQLVFYNRNGLRFLQLAVQLAPQSAAIHLKLGLSSLSNQQWEGLLYLQEARKLAPEYATALQALYLAYQDLQQTKVAQYWHDIAYQHHQKDTKSLEWRWAELSLNSLFTYISFESNLLLAVEPTLRSIVTKVLLAEGDWFEDEMELWRNHLQPGMTVIDVGANAGVYTFSAAQKVGKEGKVIAVEPFSGCVQCLKETCRVNNLTWVKVCEGAASDFNGTAYLSLHNASELNEVVADKSAQGSGKVEEVACFTLDSLIKQENLSRIDWLKIDAEGHEIKVLAGGNRVLSEFKPNILYENIAGAKGSNLPVAELLQSKGYQLFLYRPYLQDLIPVNSPEELNGNLNIIALHNSKI